VIERDVIKGQTFGQPCTTTTTNMNWWWWWCITLSEFK